jgi:NADPH2:quinone reductase
MTRAVFVHETGGAEVLKVEPHDPGAPGPGTARVRVAAAGVNFIDIYFRTGLYPRPLPFVEGLEGAGVVEAVAPDVSTVAPGDRVAWAGAPGSYADRVLAPAGNLVRIPEGVSDSQAAACMLQGMTAHYLAHGVRATQPGDVALVHAAAGGTGLLLVQTLAAAGATVIGTCSSEDKEKLAREAGAAHVIRYTDDDVAARVRELTDGIGAHVVYDGVGRTTFQASLASLRPRGLLALFGQASGPVPPFELQELNNRGSLFITRPSLAHYVANREELEMRAGAVLAAVAGGQLSVRIGAEFALDQAARAQRALESRETTGKVLLYP